jgi:hypothetical protein
MCFIISEPISYTISYIENDNKDPTTYGVARGAGPLFQDENNNSLINELDIYILDKLSMFQTMHAYTVTADTDIDNYVHECTNSTILVDGTKIYRFSKELLGPGQHRDVCCIQSALQAGRPTHWWRSGHVLQG